MGISPATQLQQKQPFSGAAGQDAATAQTYTASIPAETYDASHRREIDNVSPETTYTLWSVDDDSAISSEFDWAIIRNVGGMTLHYEVTVDGGTVDELVTIKRIKPGADHQVDGVQANATEAAAGFAGTITGRVTKLRVYNPDDTIDGAAQLFMWAEPE